MYSNFPPAEDTALHSSILTVSQLNHQIRYLLENNYSHVQVIGEISNLAKPASGHIYFTLKDKNAQIRVALFRSSTGSYTPNTGDRVVVRGRISLYEPRGDYQMIASSLKPEGEGDLQLAFLQLKEKLEKEGLFDPAHKKAIPITIKTIGVVTSKTGAAVHDILTVLKRRFPSISIVIYPTLVQGSLAAKSISEAIEQANQRNEVDVLVVGRGGGSIEDLWAFNEEIVARSIYASKLPIVSAVGHEVDFTISDFVADARSPTPSAAAELLSPDQQSLIQAFDQMENRLVNLLESHISIKHLHLDRITSRLRHPGEKLNEQQRIINQLSQRLTQSLHYGLKDRNATLELLEQRIWHQSPQTQIDNRELQISGLFNKIMALTRNKITLSKQELASNIRAINLVNPLQTLERGYAIALTDEGNAITSPMQVKEGELITVKVHKGSLKARVKSCHTDK